jgi:3-oxoacyl-[acyl-carrier protein] reductase
VGVLVRGDDGLAALLADADGEGVVLVPPIGVDPRPLEDDWDSRCDEPLRWALDAAQAARDHLLGVGGGRLVFVVPSFGLTGATGLVAEATAAEGVRSLAKSAARQWGAEGITVACVARRVAGPEVALPSLPPPTAAEVADAVAVLLDPRSRAITGATVVVDGGTVLAP